MQITAEAPTDVYRLADQTVELARALAGKVAVGKVAVAKLADRLRCSGNSSSIFSIRACFSSGLMAPLRFTWTITRALCYAQRPTSSPVSVPRLPR